MFWEMLKNVRNMTPLKSLVFQGVLVLVEAGDGPKVSMGPRVLTLTKSFAHFPLGAGPPQVEGASFITVVPCGVLKIFFPAVVAMKKRVFQKKFPLIYQ